MPSIQVITSYILHSHTQYFSGTFLLRFHNASLQQVEKVKLMDRLMDRVTVEGTLYVTDSHLIFMDANCRQEKWVCLCLDTWSCQSVEIPNRRSWWYYY